MHPLHRRDVSALPGRLVAVAEQRVNRLDEAAFLVRSGAGEPRVARRRKPAEHLAAAGDVARARQHRIVRERLAPVRHREPRIELARTAEGLDRVVVLEVVEQRDAAKKVRLRIGSAGGGEVNSPET